MSYPDNFNARAFDAMWDTETTAPCPYRASPLIYRPMPPALRQAALLALSLGYGPDSPQASSDAPDCRVAFLIQSMMDDYAEAYDPADLETAVKGAERGWATL